MNRVYLISVGGPTAPTSQLLVAFSRILGLKFSSIHNIQRLQRPILKLKGGKNNDKKCYSGRNQW